MFFVSLNYCALTLANNPDSIALASIKKGECKKLQEIIRQDATLSNIRIENYLHDALIYQQTKIFHCLISLKNFPPKSPDFLNKLLITASEYPKSRIINILLINGANINYADSLGSTPLMHAASNGRLKNARLLLRQGANLNVLDKKGLSASDYAIKHNHQKIYSCFTAYFERHLPNYSDGPYIKWVNRKKIKIIYLFHDSLRNRTYEVVSFSKVNNDIFTLNIYDINSVFQCNKIIDKSYFQDTSQIFVVGDVHGGYEGMKNLLINNHIVDSQLKWNWGNNHLVFMGDIFDRGDGVTQSLWLIYKLECQSASYGGHVHLLLGNHEIINLTKDSHYLSKKYFYLFKNLNLNYTSHYKSNYELGRWLRTKNTILRINDVVFVHGGLSPLLASMTSNIDSVNNTIRRYLQNQRYSRNDPVFQNFLLGEQGPFWYRGYIEDNLDYSKIKDNELDTVLKKFNANFIVIGHSNVDQIKAIDHNKVFVTDVPFYQKTLFSPQGLLINKTGFFRANLNGTKEIIVKKN